MMRAVLYVLLLAAVYGDTSYQHTATLDSENKFVMQWNVNYSKEIVDFKLTVALNNSDEWFAFGFSDRGELTDADLLVVWTNPTNARFFKDAHTDNASLIHIDKHQDFLLIESCVHGSNTTLTFSRKFDTCHGDYVFDRGTTHVLYLVGKGRPHTVENVNAQTLESGVHWLQLLKPDIIHPTMPADAFHIDIVVPRVAIPPATDTTWWVITKLPPMHKKHHIIGYGGIMDKHQFVHHLGLLNCPKGKTLPYYSGNRFDYHYVPAKGVANAINCFRFIAARGDGELPMKYPDETGMPIGGPGYSPYIMLEVHYHNPKHITGFTDQSGIRLIVTPTLRQYDAAVLDVTGTALDFMAIPPGQKDFTLKTMCTPQCTEVGLPPKGIHIFGYKIHNHLTGRRVNVQLIRNGNQLSDILRDDHYTPLFQEWRYLQPLVNILPGDSVIFNLVGNTMGRKHPAVTGLAYSNIMYTANLHYYPEVKLASCRSHIAIKSLNRFFALMRRLGGDATSSSKTPTANYNSIKWTPLKTYILKQFYKNSPVAQKCLTLAGKELLAHRRSIPQPKIPHPITPNNTCH